MIPSPFGGGGASFLDFAFLSSLYILGINHLSNRCIWEIFSHYSMGFLFTWLAALPYTTFLFCEDPFVHCWQ